jgi:hypothetical protein
MLVGNLVNHVEVCLYGSFYKGSDPNRSTAHQERTSRRSLLFIACKDFIEPQVYLNVSIVGTPIGGILRTFLRAHVPEAIFLSIQDLGQVFNHQSGRVGLQELRTS